MSISKFVKVLSWILVMAIVVLVGMHFVGMLPENATHNPTATKQAAPTLGPVVTSAPTVAVVTVTPAPVTVAPASATAIPAPALVVEQTTEVPEQKDIVKLLTNSNGNVYGLMIKEFAGAYASKDCAEANTIRLQEGRIERVRMWSKFGIFTVANVMHIDVKIAEKYPFSSAEEAIAATVVQSSELGWTHRVGDPGRGVGELVAVFTIAVEGETVGKELQLWLQCEEYCLRAYGKSNSVPTQAPTATPVLTQAPTATPVPTQAPTATPVPTQAPTAVPTATPVPTQAPTATPAPTQAPTAVPTATPNPTHNSDDVVVTEKPTRAPAHNSDDVVVTEEPTVAPNHNADEVVATAKPAGIPGHNTGSHTTSNVTPSHTSEDTADLVGEVPKHTGGESNVNENGHHISNDAPPW